jgi:hypothetical protein
VSDPSWGYHPYSYWQSSPLSWRWGWSPLSIFSFLKVILTGMGCNMVVSPICLVHQCMTCSCAAVVLCWNAGKMHNASLVTIRFVHCMSCSLELNTKLVNCSLVETRRRTCPGWILRAVPFVLCAWK